MNIDNRPEIEAFNKWATEQGLDDSSLKPYFMPDLRSTFIAGFVLKEKLAIMLENKNDNYRMLLIKCLQVFVKIKRREIAHYEECDYIQDDESICSCGTSDVESDIFEIIRELKGI